MRERATKLAEENKALVSKFVATRRSTRPKKKSRKVLEMSGMRVSE